MKKTKRVFSLDKFIDENFDGDATRFKKGYENMIWPYECYGKSRDEVYWAISEGWTKEVEIEEPPKELTVKEISELLGYDVKIVKE